MPKASPMVRSFNAGEFSELLSGRVDLDRYPASLRSMLNCIAAPQGPAVSRSGTQIVTTVRDESEYSALLPFVFSNEQALVLEFAQDRIRFLTDAGLEISETDASVSVVSTAGNPLVVDTNIAAEVGDQLQIAVMPASHVLNGAVANVTGKSGTELTLDVSHDADLSSVTEVGLVYHVDCAYTESELRALRYVQSVDVVYLLSMHRQPRKLSRYGQFDWRLEDVQFLDGPYLPINATSTTLTPGGTGNAIPDMTSDTAPSGVCSSDTNRPAISGTAETPDEFLGRDLTYSLDASEAYYAFDNDDETYWAANNEQSGYIEYEPATPFVCDGYTIYAATDNQDTSYASKDYAPSSWVFEGYDGSSWIALDRQDDYVLYDGNKSVFIEIENDTAYEKYRLRVIKLVRNGLIEPRIRRFVMREKDSASFNLTASAVTGINNDTGFKASDVGRLVRLKGSDTAWRSCEITAYVSATEVTVKLLGEPLLDQKEIRQWRLGYWSDTTGWPGVGTFFEDRLWLAGSAEYPDMFAGSVTGDYENFRQTDTFGVVLDDSAVVGALNSRRLSRVRWLSSDTRGLLLGTGSEEYTISAASNEAITARNIKARPATRRGSADVEPVQIDSQTLYVQRSGRAVREFAFVFEADGYKSPSMSQLASHLGAVPFVALEYAAEPHSIVWVLRSNGSVVGLTYNRDENVIGWHRHDFSGGTVDSMAVIPQSDQLQDALWLVVKRTVNGEVRRYVERLTRFWDFDTSLADAWFVDAGIRQVVGTATAIVTGLHHLEGETVYGLADKFPVGPLVVEDGMVELPFEANDVVMGLGYESVGELPRLENGAADGTAQGKVKRINSLVVRMWRSFGGEIGTYNADTKTFEFNALDYPGRFDEFEEISDETLFTGDIGPIQPAAGYDLDGIIAFRRPKESTLPFNPVAIMPQLHTQDR